MNEWRDHPRLPFIVREDGVVASGKTGKVLLGTDNGNGYMRVSYRLPGEGRRTRTATLHRIVAETWIANPEDKPAVNHKDGVKNHNHPSNLEWVTDEENIRHAYAHGLLVPYVRTEAHRVLLAKLAAECQRDTGGRCVQTHPIPA